MTEKLKISCNWTKPLLAWLQAEAQRLAINVSELLRRIVDEARHKAG